MVARISGVALAACGTKRDRPGRRDAACHSGQIVTAFAEAPVPVVASDGDRGSGYGGMTRRQYGWGFGY
jgi:hypothetical protein